MGLARELSEGPRRPRNRPGQTGDFAALRRLTRAANPDPTELRAILDRVAVQAARPRFAEGAAYIAAVERYRALTGEDYAGPRQGFY